MTGYSTRVFPDGAIVVFEWLEMTESAGAFSEGPRRQVDVMVRDSLRFAQSGEWGFQRFVGDSKTDLAATPTPQQCFACHDRLKKDGTRTQHIPAMSRTPNATADYRKAHNLDGAKFQTARTA